MRRILASLTVVISAGALACTARKSVDSGVEGGVEDGWSAPANPAPSPALPTAVYEGKLVTGFETSSFSLCGTDERWWLEGNDRPIDNFLSTHPWLRSKTGFNVATLFVTVRGTPTATGNYGHGGSYPRTIAVDEVLEVRPYLEADCRRPGA